MTERTIISKLVHFGLTTDEAETYLLLLRLGPSPARTIYRTRKVNRMNAYRTLKTLEAKALVETIIGRPVKYIAAPLDDTLERIVAEEKIKFDRMLNFAEDIKLGWSKISEAFETPTDEPKFRILQGRQQVYDHISQVCERAKESILIVTTQNDLWRLSYSNVADTINNTNLGIENVKVLTEIQTLDVEIEEYQDFAELRHIKLPTKMRFVIVDEREAITTFAMDDTMSMTTKDDIGLWVDAPNFVTAISTSLSALWQNSIPAKDVIVKLKQEQKGKTDLTKLYNYLEEAGWLVEVPGRMKGKSGLEHTFSLVAKQLEKPEQSLLIDQITRKDDILQQLVLLSAKATEVDSGTYVLMSSEPLDTSVERMAELYELRLVHSEDMFKLISEFT